MQGAVGFGVVAGVPSVGVGGAGGAASSAVGTQGSLEERPMAGLQYSSAGPWKLQDKAGETLSLVLVQVKFKLT